MKKVLSYLNQNLEWVLSAVMLSVMSVVIILQVIMRYIFSNSLSWSEEFARYLFVWLTYLGSSYAVTAEKHMHVDGFVNLLPVKFRWIFHMLSDLAFLAFSVIVVTFSYGTVGTFMNTAQKSPSMGIPMWILYASVLVGFALTAFRILQHMGKIIRTEVMHKGWKGETK